MAPLPGVRLTVVLDRPVSVYSGMVPGVVSGQYTPAEAEIDAWTLARRADARIIDAPAIGLDLDAQRVRLDARPPLPFDAVSLDVGSTVAGLETPGVRAHAIPTRPIGRFLERIAATLADAHRYGARPPRILVVGGGAGGIELAFTLQKRTGGEITLLDAGGEILPGWTPRLAALVHTSASRRGIRIRTGVSVVSVERTRVLLAGGEAVPCDLVVWVTGAAAWPWLRETGLPTDERGFVRVGPTLQVEGHPAVFGAGDCVALAGHPGLGKAGVYAVRQGPVLSDNLRAYLDNTPLRPYRPQAGFLTLLNLGDGSAIGARGRMAFSGAWVWRWKDRIDRAFMEKFQVLTRTDTPAAAFPAMGSADMVCGGCAAKVGADELTRALGRLGVRDDPSVELGLDQPDDAAIVRTPGGERIGLTIDAFTAFCKDPWIVGRVAAVNAINDLYAKGMTPRWALAIVGIPDEGPRAVEDTLFQVMHGARTTLDSLGVTLVGGHTLRTTELQVGFSVTGVVTGPVRRISGLRAGDALVLTRALGSGVVLYANQAGRARGSWMRAAVARMVRSHQGASRIAADFDCQAATDVTGFGLAGHLLEMAEASACCAVLSLGALPLLPGVTSLLRQGVRSTFHDQNATVKRRMRGPALADPRADVLYDPQTAGGLLFAIAASRATDVVTALHRIGELDAAVIGHVEAGEGLRVEP